jgi:glycosyltransferase involved in cell wall biosynthesis
MMKISVLINNYNYGRYLRACIDSVLAQDYAELEIVVVDDGSTDDSRDIISSYGSQIVPVFKENGGQASSFNAGFAAASGEIIFLLDSDDAFLPGKLRQIARLYDRDSLDWCFDRVTTTEAEGPSEKLEVQMYDQRDAIRRGHYPSIPVPTSGLSFRRSLIEQILPMKTAKDVVLSDNYLKFAAVYLGRGAIVSTPLTFQRIHQANRYTGTSRASSLRPKIMIATGLELARRYSGLHALGKGLIAGGIAEAGTPFTQLRMEAERALADSPFGQLAVSQIVIAAARKRLIGKLKGYRNDNRT